MGARSKARGRQEAQAGQARQGGAQPAAQHGMGAEASRAQVRAGGGLPSSPVRHRAVRLCCAALPAPFWRGSQGLGQQRRWPGRLAVHWVWAHIMHARGPGAAAKVCRDGRGQGGGREVTRGCWFRHHAVTPPQGWVLGHTQATVCSPPLSTARAHGTRWQGTCGTRRRPRTTARR